MYPILGLTPTPPPLPDVVVYDWKTGMPVNVAGQESKSQRHVRDPKFWGAPYGTPLPLPKEFKNPAQVVAVQTTLDQLTDTQRAFVNNAGSADNPAHAFKRRNGKVISVSTGRLVEFINRALDYATPEETEAGMKWYGDARGFIDHLAERYNVSPEVAAAVVSAISPRKRWNANKDGADTVLSYLEQGIDDPYEIGSTFAKNIEMAIRAVRKNNPNEVTGAKRRSFINNLLDPDNDFDVTVDGWVQTIVRVAYPDEDWNEGDVTSWSAHGYDREKDPVNAGYVIIADAFRQVAKERGITPAQVQAIYWTMALDGKFGGSMYNTSTKGLPLSDWPYTNPSDDPTGGDWSDPDYWDAYLILESERREHAQRIESAWYNTPYWGEHTRYANDNPIAVAIAHNLRKPNGELVIRIKALLDGFQDVETKIRRVRNSAYWGAPYGTPLPLPERYRRNRPSRVRVRRRSQSKPKPAAEETPLPGRDQNWTPTMRAYVRNHDDWSYGGEQTIRYHRYHVMQHTTADGNTYYIGRAKNYWGEQYFFVRRGRTVVERSTLAAAVRVANEDLLAPRGAGDPPRKPTQWWTAAMGRHFDEMADDPRWSYGQVDSRGWGSRQDALVFKDGDDRYTISVNGYGTYNVQSGSRSRSGVSFRQALRIVDRRLLPRIPVDHPPPPLPNSPWTPAMDRWLNEHPDWYYQRLTGGIPALCYGTGRNKVTIQRNDTQYRYGYDAFRVITPAFPGPTGKDMPDLPSCTRVIHNPQFMDRRAAEERRRTAEQMRQNRMRGRGRNRGGSGYQPPPQPEHIRHKLKKTKSPDKPMDVIKDKSKGTRAYDDWYGGYGTVQLSDDDTVEWSTDKYTDEEREEIESALAEVRDQMKSLAEKEIVKAGIPGTVKARAFLSLGESPQITVWIEARNSHGGETVELTRTFNVSRKSVYNASWVVQRDYQGHGLATKLTPQLEDLYRSWGMETVSVSANIDVGGFAWARLGFDFEDDWERNSFYRRMETYLDEQGSWGAETYGLDQDAIKAAKDDFEVLKRRMRNGRHKVTPAELASIGYREGKTEWYGKRFMLETDWAGVKKL